MARDVAPSVATAEEAIGGALDLLEPNIGRRLSAGGVSVRLDDLPSRWSERESFVLLTLSLEPLPEFAEIPPGGRIPWYYGESWAQGYLLVRVELWPHQAGSESEKTAAEALLDRATEALTGSTVFRRLP